MANGSVWRYTIVINGSSRWHYGSGWWYTMVADGSGRWCMVLNVRWMGDRGRWW